MLRCANDAHRTHYGNLFSMAYIRIEYSFYKRYFRNTVYYQLLLQCRINIEKLRKSDSEQRKLDVKMVVFRQSLSNSRDEKTPHKICFKLCLRRLKSFILSLPSLSLSLSLPVFIPFLSLFSHTNATHS